MSVILVFMIIIIIYLIVYFIYKQKISQKIKGICYFDIDDTLTTANGNRDEII
jgi:uncharacterized membrane protein YobD (UPF0266 family)